MKPIPAKPRIIMAQAEGSGTEENTPMQPFGQMVLEGSAILELAVGIVTEEVRRTDRPIRPCDCLRLVVKIGKREIMSLRETLHILKRVFGIVRSIVRANRRKAHALRHQ